MLKLSRLLLRFIGIGIVLIGMGSLLLASRYSGAQERAFYEELVSKHPDMATLEALALMDAFGRSNEAIIWIMMVTNVVWICVLGVLARAGEINTRAEPGGPANGSQPIRSETNPTPGAAGSRR